MHKLPVKIHAPSKTAVVPDLRGAGMLIPHARKVIKNGRPYLLVPANKEELHLLRNLGFDAPTPLGIDYDWAGNVPFEAQINTADLLVHSPRAYVLNDMGTGKTLSTLFAFDYLRKQGLANKMLVIAPLSTMATVWEREVFSRMRHMSAVSLHGTADKRRKLLEQDHDVYVINHHGVETILGELNNRSDIDVIVIDELARYRNKSTQLWKAANIVCKGRKFVWGLTGSPTPKEPADAWAQIVLLTPERTTRYYKQFREMTMRQVSQFRWIPKPDANDVVFSQMQPAVRYSRSDCVDLPPTTYTDIECELTKEQAVAYKKLNDDCFMEFQAGTVTAANEGVLVSKLLQVACGFAYTDKKVVSIDCNKKMAALLELLEEARNKVIVFTPFVESVNRLYDRLTQEGVEVARVYGDVKKSERDEIFNAFQFSNSPRVIVAHPECMAHGLTLTAADTIVWFCPPLSLEIYEQANARITRPGQKNNTLIAHMESTPLERKIYSRLRSRAAVQGALLEMYAEKNPSVRRS